MTPIPVHCRPACLAIALAGACLAGSAAAAQTVEQKLCVYLSAERLPAVPGLEIRASSVSSASPGEVAQIIVASFPDPLRALEDINRRFALAPGERDMAVRRAAARGESDAARATLVGFLTGILTGAARTEITIKAAGQEGTYGFACAWRSAKDVVSAPLGLLR